MSKKPHPVDVHVGQRVRMRRMMLGISQEKLADGVGLTFQQIQKYEKGVNRMGSSRLVQFAGILNVSVSFFFDGAPGAAVKHGDDGSALINQLMSTSGGVTMAKAFLALDPDVRHEFVGLIAAVAGTAAKLKRKAA